MCLYLASKTCTIFKMQRRNFLKKTTLLSGWPIIPFKKAKIELNFNDVDWKVISKQFVNNNNIINLNSGSAGLMSKATFERLQQSTLQMLNISPYKVFEQWQATINNVKQKLASLINAQNNEITIVRNTTEAINLILQGYPFKTGDELLLAQHDYPYVINTAKNLALKKGIKLKQIELDLKHLSDSKIIRFYKNSINNKTKLVVLTHLTHATGKILPIKKITAIAHKKGAEVLIDAAHSFAHIPHSVSDINCDYYATSLHKWLSAPYGNGLLYIKKDKIKKINPVISSYEKEEGEMSKFHHLGTRAFQNIISIEPAIDFLLQLGVETKYNRLKQLTKHWIQQLDEIENSQLITNTDNYNYTGIASFKIEGKCSREIVKSLYKDYGIIAKSVGIKNGSAIRISSNIFILEEHLDKMIEAIKEIASRKNE